MFLLEKSNNMIKNYVKGHLELYRMTTQAILTYCYKIIMTYATTIEILKPC